MQQVEEEKGDQGHLVGLIDELQADLGDQEPECQLEDPEGELHRDAWVFAHFRELYPHHREDRAEHDDEEGIEELGHRGRHFPTHDDSVDVPVRKQGQRGPGLLETGPEGHVDEHEDEQHDHSVFPDLHLPNAVFGHSRLDQDHGDEDEEPEQDVVQPAVVLDQVIGYRDHQQGQNGHKVGLDQRAEHLFLSGLGDVESLGLGVIASSAPEDEQGEEHSDARQGEAVFESVGLPDIGHHRGRQERPDVDADVKYGKTRISPWIPVLVQLSDHR